MGRRGIDWLLIVVLTGVWAGLFVRGIGEGLRTQRGFIDVRVSSARAGDYPTVQDGPVSDPAFEPRDRVIAVDGTDLRDASQLDFYDLATRGARERGDTVIRGERDGRPFEARVPLTPREGWWLGFAMQAIGMAVALTILLQAPDRRLARLLFVSLWAWIALNATMDPQQGLRGTRGEVILAGGLGASFAVSIVWIAQSFTRSARPVPISWRALAVACGVALAANTVFRTSVPHTWSQIIALLPIVHGLVVVATLAGLSRAYLRADALERRQLRWVVLGFYVAFIGVFTAMQLTLVGVRTSARVLSAVSATALYAGILVAVVGYRWLDIDRLISATVSYTILGIAVLGGALAVIPALAGAAQTSLGIEASAAQWLLTLGLVGAAIPAHHHLWPQIDRRLFAGRHRRVAGLEHLRDELDRCSGAEELWALASERIDELLEPISLVVYTREGDRFTPRFARGRESSPPYPADSLLARALERHGRPLAADSPEIDPFDRAALETLGVALFVPIRGGQHLVGFACLGAKRTNDIYSREEMHALRAIAARCAELLGDASGDPPQIFRHDGELWTIASRGKQIHLRDMRGLHHLATLLREPGREFAALDLARSAGGLATMNGAAPEPELRVSRSLGDAGPMLDAQARSEYRARLVELDAELADAERCADLGRVERASAEREALFAELGSSQRGAAPGSDAQRARIAVTKAIKLALEKIAEAHPELGAHLATTIRRGFGCAYEPDPRDAAAWEV